jgi:hypothetical protein
MRTSTRMSESTTFILVIENLGTKERDNRGEREDEKEWTQGCLSED